MTRFRAVTMNHRRGPWLPTRQLALQDAVEDGEAHRDPHSGLVYLSAGTRIEEDAGEAEASEERRRWGAALELLARYQATALGHIDDELRRPYSAERLAGLQDARKRIKTVLEDARRTARRERPDG